MLFETSTKDLRNNETKSGMIIDCHGHYTTAPPALGEYRENQKAELETDASHQAIKG